MNLFNSLVIIPNLQQVWCSLKQYTMFHIIKEVPVRVCPVRAWHIVCFMRVLDGFLNVVVIVLVLQIFAIIGSY